MNPKTQECFGLYGYGSGFFAAEMQARANETGDAIASFCDRCPRSTQCWNTYKRHIDREYPDETAAFIAAMDQAQAAGDSQAGGRLAVRLYQQGTPDPWLRGFQENVSRGAEDRSRMARE